MHWACAKVSACGDVPDEALRDAIVARLRSCPGARYATVAAHAQAAGRRGLAALLLEHETVAAEQARARFFFVYALHVAPPLDPCTGRAAAGARDGRSRLGRRALARPRSALL